jgi:septum formation protein
VYPSGAEELEAGAPPDLALENARRKAAAVRAGGVAAADALILGCDTVVALEGRIYGKPADEQDARATLRALSGRTHTVISGLALLLAGEQRTGVAQTDVRFRTLSQELIDWYVSTGEWRDRAGGYAIQGAGAALVRSIEGDYENVVGLPVALLLDLCPELLPRPRAG